MFTTKQFHVSFDVVILKIRDGTVVLFKALSPDNDGDAMIKLEDCTFDYSDGRCAPQPSTVAQIYSSILTIEQPSGARVSLCEYRFERNRENPS
jgi:hypothetical protein